MDEMQIAHFKNAPRRAVRAASRAGFTLIEILAVILIIGILSTFVIPQVISAIGLGKSSACQANLNSISRGFLEYQTKYSRIPKGSGVSFFASLITEKVWDPSVKNSKTLTCPAVALSFLSPGQDEIPVEDWFLSQNRDVIDGGYSSYAGRDQKRHALRNMNGKGKTALVADDNDPTGNHSTTTNVLWDDLSVRALELVDLQTEGLLSEDEDVEFIPVGSDSPVPGLEVLTLD
ncbi:MAG: prepilin-type N-terminal cleavage/methylation domain-containing protein [Planctomycetota bacterium]|jgi:prepilin-type N-terminal cleavage/methylation domain-containing protein